MSMSKLKCSGGERRVTRQMTAAMRESRNPLRIPEMLENILGFLPVEDLKRCRLVNKFWKDTALKPTRKKCALITFGRRTKDIPVSHALPEGMGMRVKIKLGGESIMGMNIHDLEEMEKFLYCFSADPSSNLLGEVRDDIPCTKFEIFTNIINEESSDGDKLIMANFLQAISPWVTQITLEGGKDIGRLLKGVDELKFPSLKHIVFSTINSKDIEAFSPWMSVFVMNSPHFEKLGLLSRYGRQQQHHDPSFFQFLSQNKGLKIKELSIYAKIENNDLLVLSESDLKLKSLTLDMGDFSQLSQLQIPMPSLPQLLKQQSENLERLSIYHFYGTTETESVPFPIMKKLKSMNGTYPGLINYAKQTPSLEIIHEKAWRKFSNGEMEPAPGVKEVCFRRAPTTAEEILGALRIFPNISKLEMPADNVYVPIVYKSLPNLEELTLSTWNTSDSIDMLLTGLTNEGYQHAVQTLGNWTSDFDDSGIQIGIQHSPISVLTNLKLLRLRASNAEFLEVTAVSLCLVLMKMPSLQILDLCNRSEAPDKEIPKPVLKEFRKNRLILWNLKRVLPYHQD